MKQIDAAPATTYAAYPWDGLNGAERHWCIVPWHVRTCLKAERTRDYAIKALARRYRSPRDQDGWPGNAFLHCTWIGVLSIQTDDDNARGVGERHEQHGRGNMSKYFFDLSKKMDLHNNSRGIQIGNGVPGGNEWYDWPAKAKATAAGCRGAQRAGTLYTIYRDQNFTL
jgi:hypothetical protein